MKLFYLQNVGMGCCGNSPYWWHQTNSGYTPRLDDAKQFTATEADDIIRSTKGSHRWKKWPVTKVDKAAHRTVDMQDLK